MGSHTQDPRETCLHLIQRSKTMLITVGYFLVAVSAVTIDEHNEKLIRVWEDRIQNTELDADEVNFPLFLQPDLSSEKDSFEMAPDLSLHTTKVSDPLEDPDRKHGFITIRSNFTSDNITRHDVSHIPMHAVGPLIKNALSSLTGEDLSIVALGGLLPLLALFLPLTVMAVMLPILLIMTVTMFGVMTSALFFSPLALMMFGTYLATESFFELTSDKVSNLDPFSQFENFQVFDDVDEISEKIQNAVENITVADEETTFKPTFNNIPRFFS